MPVLARARNNLLDWNNAAAVGCNDMLLIPSEINLCRIQKTNETWRKTALPERE
jgi:hypothetical protein